MLRITITTTSDGLPAVLLEGRLVGPWVAELHRFTLDEARAAPARLDLGGLAFADGDGIALLRDLKAKGFELCAASSFLAALMGGGDGRTRELG